jgi:phosphatidylinositol kinase/protein kinase (PI-3  family)
MNKIKAKIQLAILATLGHKLSNKELNELSTAIQDIVKAEAITAYNVGKHNALDNIEITSEEYFKNK